MRLNAHPVGLCVAVREEWGIIKTTPQEERRGRSVDEPSEKKFRGVAS
jgi:hypothetical protein